VNASSTQGSQGQREEFDSQQPESSSNHDCCTDTQGHSTDAAPQEQNDLSENKWLYNAVVSWC
jgi:hypothetical protein